MGIQVQYLVELDHIYLQLPQITYEATFFVYITANYLNFVSGSVCGS